MNWELLLSWNNSWAYTMSENRILDFGLFALLNIISNIFSNEFKPHKWFVSCFSINDWSLQFIFTFILARVIVFALLLKVFAIFTRAVWHFELCICVCFGGFCVCCAIFAWWIYHRIVGCLSLPHNMQLNIELTEVIMVLQLTSVYL